MLQKKSKKLSMINLLIDCSFALALALVALACQDANVVGLDILDSACSSVTTLHGHLLSVGSVSRAALARLVSNDHTAEA